jgi:peptide/nickel transport system permease protein
MTGPAQAAIKARPKARQFAIRLPSPARCILIVIGLLVAVAAIYPHAFTSLNPNTIDPNAILAGPSLKHWLGTDEAGGDIYTRIVYGTRLDAEISVFSVALAYLIGVPLGVLAGRQKGAVSEVLTTLSGGILAFPIVLLALLIVGSFGASAKTLIVIFGLAFFPQVALLARAQTLAVFGRGYILSARAAGLGERKIVTAHVLHNIAGPLLVLVPQLMATAILAEAGLSYLGVGVQPPAITWGSLLLDSTNYYHSDPLYAISAGLVITIAAVLLLITGDLVSESMDPLRRR